MIERLKECPNCAGILNESGRCTFCGSKVYDLMAIDFAGRSEEEAGKPAKSFIRIRTRMKNGKVAVIIAPIMITDVLMETKCDDTDHFFYTESECMPYRSYSTTIDISCKVCGDKIVVEEEY
jgi:DNA-directed RNA polymerase subunit RPC12/RpoP